MPHIQAIKKAMFDQKMPKEIIEQFTFSQTEENIVEEVVSLLNQMDKLLTEEQRLSIMEEDGCYKTGQADEMNASFGRIHEGKTVEERIALFNDENVHPNVPCHVNADGTLTVFWEIGEKGFYHCVCAQFNKLKENQPQTKNITKTFCGCCGGHIRHHYQNILGVKLKLIEIVSSPISSNGEKRCEFLFEIMSST